ncbi:MAG: GNAT family N-acetyltransferase [Acetobacteraceae bacterium]
MSRLLPAGDPPLARLFRPRSVLVVGDTEAPGPAAAMLDGLRAGGFAGPISAARPDRLVEALATPGPAPDLAVVAGGEDPGALLDRLAAAGVGGAILTGPAPAEPALPFLGGGSFGLIVPAIGLNASPLPDPPPAGPIALIGQSRGFARAVIEHAAAHGLGFAFVAGLGRNEGVGFSATLDWLAREPGVAAILLEVSRIRDRRGFLSAARAAARSRPVVAIRTAPDEDGAADAPPADLVFAAALRRSGILCVDGLEAMLAAIATLPRTRPLRGERIAVISRTRALAGLAERALARHGLALVPPPPETAPALSTLLPAESALANPWIIPDDAPPTRAAELAAALAELGAADAALIVHVPDPRRDGPAASPAAEALATAAALSRRLPMLAVWPGEDAGGTDRARLEASGIPAFPTPEQAASAAHLLVEHRRAREAAKELPPRTVLGIDPDRETVRRILDGARAAGRRSLTEDESLAVLAAYGIATVPTRVAADGEAAAQAATALGFPAVLKVRSPDLSRKTEVGGVALDLSDAAEVRRAAEAMLGRVRRAAPEARLEGFLVQRQALLRGVQEVLVRVGQDGLFGPAILFGAGGTKASVLRDLAAALPPLNLALARDLVSRTLVSRVLAGFRDQPRADLDALCGVLVRLSQLVVDQPELVSIDVNPLLAGPAGAVALDAGMTLSAEPRTGTAHLSIAPYPAELEESVVLADGRTACLRPIRPEDAEAHLQFFARLSPEDVRMRFFAPISSLSPEQVARMTQIDYDREMALIATAPGPEGAPETLGVVRIVALPGRPVGEFAVVVRSDLKGLGLGSLLMRKAIDWARGAGFAEIEGEVLAENRPMRAFVQRLGFTLHRHPDDPDLTVARLGPL